MSKEKKHIFFCILTLTLCFFAFYSSRLNSKKLENATSPRIVETQPFPLSSLKDNLSKKKKTNLLFLIYDDLRPELSIYGKKYMNTPNFERLAKKSVTFERAVCQVAVCNPSRSSIMTGLRPDYCGSVNFEGGLGKSMTLPVFLKENGYNTGSNGKIFHWDNHTPDNLWTNSSSVKMKWYSYQNREITNLNSSVMPDKVTPLENFRDSMMVSEGLEIWKSLIEDEKPWMMAFGFKLPHLALHFPYQFYEQYRDFDSPVKDEHLSFPRSTSDASFNGFNYENFIYMQDEGATKSLNSTPLRGINNGMPRQAHLEVSRGYMASISFLDYLLGRLLDFMDAHGLWENTAVVLTADHGMHNGEKGIWNKWTLFDESTRVPLLIAHPDSPFKGKSYSQPVELTDIYPTLVESLDLDANILKLRSNKMIQGVSLAPLLLGHTQYKKRFPTKNKFYDAAPSSSASLTSTFSASSPFIPQSDKDMPILHKNFSISQVFQCQTIENVVIDPKSFPIRRHLGLSKDYLDLNRRYQWNDCSPKKHSHLGNSSANFHDIVRAYSNHAQLPFNQLGNFHPKDEIVIMGYSMRTMDFRYTCYFFFDRMIQRPILNAIPWDEELYDHQGDTASDFNTREFENLSVLEAYAPVVLKHRQRLIEIISEFSFLNRGNARNKSIPNKYFSHYQP